MTTQERELEQDDCREPVSGTISGLYFELTCGACPEQYDVYRGQVQVGYVRLRHGCLSVESPDCGGKVLLEHEFDEALLGRFESGGQRFGWLSKIALVLRTEPSVAERRKESER